jgi:ATP-binding cassette subfamily B protein RaxB
MIPVGAIRQSEAAECGLACLAIISHRLGAQIDLATLRRQYPVSSRGLTVNQLMTIAAGMKMTCRPLKCEVEDLPKLRTPAVLHWGLNHFVVLLKATPSEVVIQDPDSGIRRLRLSDAGAAFTGVAVELQRAPDFKRRTEKSQLKLTSLFRMTPEIGGGLAQVLALSLLLQAYVLASPFYMQLAIDEAALKGDRGLLTALAIGFGLFGLFNVGATALRGVALQKISALFGWDMTGRVFHHMLRLPLPWFQRRRLADSLSRFDSILPIRTLFSSGLVASVVDGLLAIATLVMMLVFSWKLALIAAAGLAAFIAIRVATIPMTIRLASEALAASIAEQGKRIETLRAIQTIKVMGAESQREADWLNRFAETVRTGQSNAFASLGFTALQTGVDAISNVAIVYVGAGMVIDNEMTVGVLFAFMAYKMQFLARTQALFETFVNWRLLDLHSNRVSDIVLTPIEASLSEEGGGLSDMRGDIHLDQVSYRYGPHDRFVFQGLNVRIRAGECVAISGASGVGKSTLMKVIAGLYPVTSGEVRIDGRSLMSWGTGNVRRQLGVVLQDDELLAGTIAENVAFFADDIDMRRVWDALEAAAINEDVRAMPMRAETLIGDMGSALSGGQKQRLLLARAFYRDPRILILDEATSHLDPERERRINEFIRARSITRIIIAHRQETLDAADRVLLLRDGRLLERPAAAPSTIAASPEARLPAT